MKVSRTSNDQSVVLNQSNVICRMQMSCALRCKNVVLRQRYRCGGMQVRSVGGVLDVQGTLRLTRAPGVVVEGTVAARPDAPPELVKQLAYLGSPDAQGRRPFSFENTF